MTPQNISINIEKIINHNKIQKEYNVIKEMEDKIIELYKKNNDTDFLNENKMGFLYEIKDDFCSIKFHKNIKEILEEFKIHENILRFKEKFVFTGSAIRSVLSPKDVYRKELFVSACEDINWKEIIDSIDTFDETDEVYYKKNKDYVIHLFKHKYVSPSEVILNGPYLKRFAFYNNMFFASPMFIMEYNLKISYIDKDFVDPVFNSELDLFDLHQHRIINKDDIFDIINKKDYEALMHITMYDLNKTKDNLTCIEYAIKLYIEEEIKIIQNQLKLIIYELLKHIKFRRDPCFYAELKKLDKVDSEMYEILLTPEYQKLRKNISAFSSIEELNISILNYYIQNDMSDEFYSYIRILYKKPSSEIFQTIIDVGPKKIITEGITKKYFSDYNIYKIILLSQQLNYINLIKFDINIAVNFLDKIIKKCLTKSFYYLYKHDQSIINTVDSNELTLLHQIQSSKNDELTEDVIRLLITLDETILSKKNLNGETPLLYHAQNKNYKITEILIKIIKEKNLFKLFEDKTNDLNNILHILSVSNDNIRLVKEIIYDNLYLLNETNNDSCTPIVISCKSSAEDIYYLLKGNGADLTKVDKFGNSTEHYICLNEMCIGMAIQNKENIFGYSPQDYCKISSHYYYFTAK